MIVDGTPVGEVIQSASSKVQVSLEKLGKADKGTNVWGRNNELQM